MGCDPHLGTAPLSAGLTEPEAAPQRRGLFPMQPPTPKNNNQWRNTMSNFLEMRCPKCSDENSLDIAATVWIRVCEDGTDADASRDGSHDYEPHSPALCGACGHCGTVRQFELAGGAP